MRPAPRCPVCHKGSSCGCPEPHPEGTKDAAGRIAYRSWHKAHLHHLEREMDRLGRIGGDDIKERVLHVERRAIEAARQRRAIEEEGREMADRGPRMDD